MTATLGSMCSFLNGGTPSRSVARFYAGKTPWITGADIDGPVVNEARSFITDEAIHASATNLVPAGTILLVTRTSVGKVAIAGTPLCFSQDITAITPDPGMLDTSYLVHFLRTKQPHFERVARGATIKGITREAVENIPVPLPPLPEQRRIAEILDKADALRAKRRAALAQLDSLTQSIFLDMFGDPATNPKGWPREAVGNLASKFSDGPFGSNLKSDHYSDGGVRVVRLQNIGVGEFVDDDKAFISEEHFGSLKKHECLPGDVLVGTLGDPNLRACIQPEWLPRALNKADCVQLRPDQRVANAEYLCALLNCPSTERMAQRLVLGQTRSRISMGRLRGLVVPRPPIELQNEFSVVVASARSVSHSLESSAIALNALFESLQHRAFRGEL